MKIRQKGGNGTLFEVVEESARFYIIQSYDSLRYVSKPKEDWEEVTTEPEWVEMDLNDMCEGTYHYEREVVRDNQSGDIVVQVVAPYEIRITEGYVKVSELEKWFGEQVCTSQQTVELFQVALANQRPMLTVWEKKP